MFLPNRIKLARKRLRLSQEKFMVFLGNNGLSVSRPTLNSWEKGDTKPNAEELAFLSMAVNRPIGYFFALKNSQTGQAKGNGRSRADR